MPAARQTDVFAEGQVQMVEFDVPASADSSLLDTTLREARLPPDSRVAAIIRGDKVVIPRGDESIQPGDRIVVIGSPQAAQAWGELIAPGTGKVRDVVIFGAGRAGTAVARLLLEQGIGVRMIEASRERSRVVAAELPGARVYNATGFDPDFLERERIADAQVAVFAMRDDLKNHFAATLAKVHGARFTVAIVHEAASVEVFEHAGVDVTVNPRQITAEEIVRFAHDPRTQQVVMLEGDRFEVLDITTKPGSEYVGLSFKEMPIRGAVIGAIVRDGKAVFPRSDEVLRTGDRVIVFTESRRVPEVEKSAVTERSRRPPLLAVDVLGALNIVGMLLAYLSVSTLVPAGFAIGYGEPFWPFLAAGAIVGAIGIALARATRGDRRLGIREGFLVVALTWLAAAALGALPYILSGDPQLGRPLDAYFEGMSGFSTTGGSIVVRVEELPYSIAIWRQFTQWVGGIGIIVLALAVLPRLRVGGRQLLEHEMPGPEIETLSTRIRDTAQRVWILYIALTAAPVPDPARARPVRGRRRDDAVPGVRARADDDSDRGLLDEGELDRGLRRGDPVGDRALHDPRRDQLRAACTARSCGASHARPPATRSSGCTSPCSSWARSSS